MKARLVYIVDSFAVDNGVEEALIALGLVLEEDYVIVNAGSEAFRIVVGNPGEKLADTPCLLVFLSTFHGSMDRTLELARWIKELNPAATIYFRSTFSKEVILNPIFDGCLDKELPGRGHPELTALIKDAFGI